MKPSTLHLYPGIVVALCCSVWLYTELSTGSAPDRTALNVIAISTVTIIALGWIISCYFFRAPSVATAMQQCAIYILIPLPILVFAHGFTDKPLKATVFSLAAAFVVMVGLGLLTRQLQRPFRHRQVTGAVVTLLQWLPPALLTPFLYRWLA